MRAALITALAARAAGYVDIGGIWYDTYGSDIRVTSTAYMSTYPGSGPSIINITYYNNTAGFLVGQNSGSGSYNPGQWSRLDWVEPIPGELHVCTTHYDANDEASAMLPNPSHDHAAYATTGCGGFAFSQIMRRPIAIFGQYSDAYGSSIIINDFNYSSTYPGSGPSIIRITHFDNIEGFLVGQNSGSGSYNPGQWSRVDWVEPTPGDLHVCTTHYDANDEASAMLPNPSHDHAAYATTGCGGFAFSALSQSVVVEEVNAESEASSDGGGVATGGQVVIGVVSILGSLVLSAVHASLGGA